MVGETLERRRTWGDVVFGVLLVILGVIVLGNAVVATVVSVYFLGWFALLSGVAVFVGAFFTIKSGGFWSGALGGAMLAVLGLFILRHPVVGAVSLTLLAGALFLSSGAARVFIGAQMRGFGWPLIVSGIISIALGLIVLFNLAEASFTLLGILLGVQTLLEGLTLMVFGRIRATQPAVPGENQVPAEKS
ncbi:HdeD family acid-resistance protein [Hoyosella sp. YIM 151337]|uniref:HdeD family acid-resistance protein n=1 Tax=Hoyosella sp. YIM 151337 TaxID=2992742 RepID=UPI002235735C|nr:HdeD family acid-resistance protein [Hoyosella sp. YIM 151337]MCW4354156.1 HdeD family acid-resistance protein [Hoyosella sp. YIM 151337]